MKKRRGDMHYMNRYGMLGNLYRVQRFCMAPSGHKFFTKKISTHLLIMEVDFCPVLCIAEMPILRAFVAFSHFVWYRRISSNELQMV